MYRYLNLTLEDWQIPKFVVLVKNGIFHPNFFFFLAKMIVVDFWSLKLKAKLSSEAMEKVVDFFKQS